MLKFQLHMLRDRCRAAEKAGAADAKAVARATAAVASLRARCDAAAGGAGKQALELEVEKARLRLGEAEEAAAAAGRRAGALAGQVREKQAALEAYERRAAEDRDQDVGAAIRRIRADSSFTGK